MSIEDTPTAELVYWLYSYGRTDSMMPVVARRLEALEANNLGWQGLAADLEHLENERDKYRDHSVLLNRVAWKIATALGLVDDDDDIRELDHPEQVLDELWRLITSRDHAVDEWRAAASLWIADAYTTDEARDSAFEELEDQITEVCKGPTSTHHFEPFDEYGPLSYEAGSA